MFFNRLYIYLFVIFLISSCTTIGPTLPYHNWDCGDGITAETKSGTCKLKAIYMHEYTYSGSVQPVNYSEAVPNGKGIIKNSKTGQLIEVTYDLGTIKNGKQKLPNGSVFEGRMSGLFDWVYGVYKTPEFTFTGGFTSNKIHKGKLVWKNNNSFDGFFENEQPQSGTFSYYAANCSKPIEYDGIFGGSFNTLDTTKRFTIKHPAAKIEGTLNEKLDFKFTIDGVADSSVNDYEWDVFFSNVNIIKNIRTKDSFLKLNDEDLSVNASTLVWDNLNDCNSYPTFIDKDNYLESTLARYIIIDNDIDVNKSSSLDFGFDTSEKIYPNKNNSQYLIFSVTSRDYNRKIVSKENIKSEYISGQREIYNNNYDTASRNLANAQAELTRAKYADSQRQSDGCYGSIWECALAEAILNEESAAQKAYDAALRKLNNTPRTIIQDIVSEYDVEKLEIEATKSIELELAFLDIGRNKIYKKQYPLELSKSFEVINSPVAETDTNKRRLLNGTSQENEVDSWMNEKISFKNSIKNLLDEILVEDNLESQRRNKLLSYLDEIKTTNSSKDVTPSKKGSKKTLFANDEYVIEDSILIVDTLQGMGTGFYVTEDYVITNQHVVEQAGFVTLRDFYDNSFTGKVVATDVATDLALISVSEYQTPLEFDNQCSIRRRENVFTVGHPKGFEYSTTRGIVSAIRDMPQPFYAAAGNKKYIQIDAAISSGNSGGPLFNSLEKVIGVNTWGRTDGQSLNFAIHCSEVKDFLSNNGVYLD